MQIISFLFKYTAVNLLKNIILYIHLKYIFNFKLLSLKSMQLKYYSNLRCIFRCNHFSVIETIFYFLLPFILQKILKALEFKGFTLYQTLCSQLVETVGVEPTSENTFTEISPSAVSFKMSLHAVKETNLHIAISSYSILGLRIPSIVACH